MVELAARGACESTTFRASEQPAGECEHLLQLKPWNSSGDCNLQHLQQERRANVSKRNGGPPALGKQALRLRISRADKELRLL